MYDVMNIVGARSMYWLRREENRAIALQSDTLTKSLRKPYQEQQPDPEGLAFLPGAAGKTSQNPCKS